MPSNTRKWWNLFVSGMMSSLLLVLFYGQPAQAETVRNLSLQLDAGYRMDELDWTLAGSLTGANPNILSELDWNDLEIYQLGIKSELELESPSFPWFSTVLKGAIDYGWLIDGKNRDSDYGGDNRTLEYSRSLNQTDEDNVFDTSVGLGFRFRFLAETLSITPSLGYSYHEQNLNLTKGTQVIGLADLTGLNSTYETEWRGPWAGLEVAYAPANSLRLFGSAEYHLGDYEAEADWNLRDDFAHPVSFAHAADYSGVTIEGGVNYRFSENWSTQISAKYLKWTTDSGIDTTYMADGSVGKTRLNETRWESRSITFGFSYHFY